MQKDATNQVQNRNQIYCVEVYGVDLYYKTCYTLHFNMEIITEARMDALVYTHFGYDSEELVFRTGSALRDNILERVDSQLQG